MAPFSDFESASRAVLKYLHDRVGLGLWMMTRTEGPDWIVLHAEDHGYGVAEGAVFNWADSFCSQMVQGLGPRAAPRAQEVPLYAAARIGQLVPIGSYIGVPVARSDGSLFGTLCAIDPSPQEESLREVLPLVELFSRMLGTLLTADLAALEHNRLLERSQQAAMTDALTGLLNRHGWDIRVAAEEMRSRRFGGPACVFIADLDNLKTVNDNDGHAAGDALICRAADGLREALREIDVVARIGGDEFAILGVECDSRGSEQLYKKIVDALAARGISASLGKAMRDPRIGLSAAMAEADREMYARKTSRRTHRLTSG